MDSTGPSEKNGKEIHMQLIRALFIRFTRNSTSIDFSSLILMCSDPLFPCPLFFPFLISSKFSLGAAAAINSRCILWGTYYVQRTKNTVPVVVYLVDWVPLILKVVVNMRWKLIIIVTPPPKKKKLLTCSYMIYV